MHDEFRAPVAVTGGTGYVASHVISELLSRGATVHCTVRDPSNDKKVGHLRRQAMTSPGTLKLFQADLLQEGSFDNSFAGCVTVIHTASPFLVGRQKNPERDLVLPALQGTRNVLESINKASSVQRVVLTSSVAAIYGESSDCHARGGLLDESHWNETSSLTRLPYAYSKTVAEAEAWKVASAQTRWRLVTINPGFVLGPSRTARRDSVSVDFMLSLINGTYRAGMFDFWMPWVDVRDVAFAHAEAAVRSEVEGRFILSAVSASVFDVIAAINRSTSHPVKPPLMKTPSWLTYLVAPLLGFDWHYLKRTMGIPLELSNKKSIERLGVQYRGLDETVSDHIDQLVADGLFIPKK